MKHLSRICLSVALALVLPTAAWAGHGHAVDRSTCSFHGQVLKGKVKIVEHHGDIKIRVVEHFPDIKVKTVKAFPDHCGEWKIVDAFPDFTVQFVEHFEDVKVKFVDHFPGV